MCLLIWTVFSGERCGPSAACIRGYDNTNGRTIFFLHSMWLTTYACITNFGNKSSSNWRYKRNKKKQSRIGRKRYKRCRFFFSKRKKKNRMRGYQVPIISVGRGKLWWKFTSTQLVHRLLQMITNTVCASIYRLITNYTKKDNMNISSKYEVYLQNLGLCLALRSFSRVR